MPRVYLVVAMFMDQHQIIPPMILWILIHMVDFHSVIWEEIQSAMETFSRLAFHKSCDWCCDSRVMSYSETPVNPICVIGTSSILHFNMTFNRCLWVLEQPHWIGIVIGGEDPALTGANKLVLMGDPVLVFIGVTATCPGSKFQVNLMIHQTISCLTTSIWIVVRPSPNNRV